MFHYLLVHLNVLDLFACKEMRQVEGTPKVRQRDTVSLGTQFGHPCSSLSSNTWVCRCSMESSRRSFNTRARGSTKQSNKICQEHQRTTWHHREPESSWITRTKGQKIVSQIQIRTDDKDPFRGWETRSTLSAYNEIVNGRNQMSMTTRAAARGEPTSVYAKSHAYYNSFLPKTIRDRRIGPQHWKSD